MFKKKNKKGNVYKALLFADFDAGKVKVSFTPNYGTAKPNPELRGQLVNVLVSGLRAGFHNLFDDIPLLRPATDAEREAKVYVFKDEEADVKLYKARKAIYDEIAAVFTFVLKDVFPDVDYINSAIQYQQGYAFELSPEEALVHQAEIEKIAKEVRESKEEG